MYILRNVVLALSLGLILASGKANAEFSLLSSMEYDDALAEAGTSVISSAPNLTIGCVCPDGFSVISTSSGPMCAAGDILKRCLTPEEITSSSGSGTSGGGSGGTVNSGSGGATGESTGLYQIPGWEMPASYFECTIRRTFWGYPGMGAPTMLKSTIDCVDNFGNIDHANTSFNKYTYYDAQIVEYVSNRDPIKTILKAVDLDTVRDEVCDVLRPKFWASVYGPHMPVSLKVIQNGLLLNDVVLHDVNRNVPVSGVLEDPYGNKIVGNANVPDIDCPAPYTYYGAPAPAPVPAVGASTVPLMGYQDDQY